MLNWSSKMSFIFAAAGCSIGLGNIWRFPYVSAQYGGGNFIFLYIVFLLILGIPLFMNDVLLGRLSGQQNTLNMLSKLKSPLSKLTYIFYVFSPILLMSFYIVVGGWSLFYLVKTLVGAISYTTTESSYYVGQLNSLFDSPLMLGLSSLAIIVITCLINLKGLNAGIEKVNNIVIPALLVMLVVLAIKVATLDGVGAGMKYYFTIDLKTITLKQVFEAMGQVAFSLSIGTAGLMVYGSYLKKDVNVPQASIAVGLMGLAVGVLSGMVVVPALFVFDYPLDSGPSLAFITLPSIFAHMQYGIVYAILFFFILFTAVITSTISLVENVFPAFMEKLKISKPASIILVCVVIYLMSIPQALSFNAMADFKIFGKTVFDLSDFLVSSVFLPCGAILASLYSGYIMKKEMIKQINSNGIYNFKWANVWLFGLKGPIPLAIAAIILAGIYFN